MKFLYIILLCLIFKVSKSQDVLINSSRFDNSNKNIPNNIKLIDSLNLPNPGFIRSIEKNANSNVRINSIIDNPGDLGKVTNDSMSTLVLKIKANPNHQATQEQQIKFLKFANQDQEKFYMNFYQRRAELRKIQSVVKSTDDSIKLLVAQIPQTRSQIKNRLFYISNLSALYDTSYNSKTRSLIIDSLAIFSAEFAMLDEEVNDLNSDAKSILKSIAGLSKSMTERDTLLSNLLKAAKSININHLKDDDFKSADTLDAITRQIKLTLDTLNMTKSFLKQENSEAVNALSSFRTLSKTFLKIKNSYEKNTSGLSTYKKSKFVEKKPALEESEFGAFPNISYLVGEQRALNLNIGILGAFTKIDSSNFNRFEARLFTGSIPQGLINTRALFIPEASTFGGQIKYVTGYEIAANKPEKKQFASTFGGTFELNFLSKQLTTAVTSTTTTTPSSGTSSTTGLNNFIIHARGGGELVLLKDVFSIYSNLNYISLVDNTARFHQQFANLDQIDNRSAWVFFDIGCKLLLNPSSGEAKKVVGSGLKIIADFDLIIPKVWGRQLINGINDVSQTDMLIPVIRLGVRKSLGVVR